MRRSRTVYACNVAFRQKKLIRAHPEHVMIVSPYLTSPAAESVVGEAEAETCRVLTTFDPLVFASGGSSIQTLKKLSEAGIRLFFLRNLHAKVLVCRHAATIGSQNLTTKGRQSREVSYLLGESKELQHLREEIEHWFKRARTITPEMIAHMADLLPPLRRRLTQLEHEAAALEEMLHSAEQERRASIETEQARQRRVEERRRARILRARSAQTQVALQNAQHAGSSVRAKIRDLEWSNPLSLWSSGAYQSLVATNHGRFETWKFDGESVSLTHRNRYLMIYVPDGRMAWPALNKTRLTKFEKELQRNDVVKVGTQDLRFDFSFPWDEDVLASHNVEVTVKDVKRTPILRVRGGFSLDHLDLVEWQPLDRNPHLRSNEISEFRDDLKKRLLSQLLSPFKYENNSIGYYVDQYLKGCGRTFSVDLHELQGHYVFAIEPVS